MRDLLGFAAFAAMASFAAAASAQPGDAGTQDRYAYCVAMDDMQVLASDLFKLSTAQALATSTAAWKSSIIAKYPQASGDCRFAHSSTKTGAYGDLDADINVERRLPSPTGAGVKDRAVLHTGWRG